jgi:Ni,Fe-hydrogenase III large subunit
MAFDREREPERAERRFFLRGKNGVPAAMADVPEAAPGVFWSAIVERCRGGTRLAALLALPEPADARRGGSELLAVLADDARCGLELIRTRIPDRMYPSLSSELPQAQAFERELFEEHGIIPVGHPWLKPLRRHDDLEPPGLRPDRPTPPHPFFRVEGAGIHEVAVGPVHAGVIEPGHFRFQCRGETVLHLEIQLGYQHRGIAAKMPAASPAARLVLAESVAGDTAVGHAQAYALAVESLAGVEAPFTAQALRGIALELERIANHVGDLGALCNDVGFLPGASWFGRLRGEFLNLLLELSGNRFGRGLVIPGGVRFGLSGAQRKDFLARIAAAQRDLRDTARMTFDTPSVCSRFERTGVVSRELAESLGLVGPVARASGCDRDARRDHPGGVYRFTHLPVAVSDTGDVMARAQVRWLEAQRSITFVQEQIAELPDGPLSRELTPAAADRVAVTLVEGWRGEIVHVAVTDAAGRLSAYRIVDPSFHNWFGLAQAMRENEVSDFPLCNKSFNLSYAGHDL